MMFTTLKAKMLAGAVIAGTTLTLAVPATQAQHVAFGVTIGAPVYVAPATTVVFRGPGYYDGVYVRDYNGWRAHQVWLRDRRFDRDRREFGRDHRFDRDGRFYRR